MGLQFINAQPGNLADKKIMILHHNNAQIPANRILDENLVNALVEAGIPTASIFSEYMEERRFFTQEIEMDYMRYLEDFYSMQPIDLVIITEESTLFFLNAYGHDFLPDVPVVLCAVSEGTPLPDWLAGRVAGNLKNIDICANIRNIQSLQPDLNELVILLGTSPQDSFFERYVQRCLDSAANLPGQIRVLKNQSMEDSLNQIGQLSSGSAVLAVSVFQDGAGRNFNPKDVVLQVVKTSPVPVYGISDTYVGTGFIGGNLISFKDLALDAAAVVIEILQGGSLRDNPVKVYRNRNYFDSDALEAAGLDPRVLPAGTVFYNHTPTLWELYWKEISFTFLFILFCLVLILTLSFQLRYRRKTETALKEQKASLETLNSELTESLAKNKTLSGLIPICSSCKKIRDDRGYWNQLEVYINEHSDAEFSHSLCPDCAKKLYPRYFEKHNEP